MKKILFSFSICLMLVLLVSCSQRAEWSMQQREAFRELVEDYREMVYLNELNNAEFMIFSDDLSSNVEDSYPVYTQLVAMPAVNDSVDVWVVTTIISELDEDSNNMRRIYPYHYLVEQGILPSGLSRDEKRAFYSCFAQKVNEKYSGIDVFFNAVVANTIDPNAITIIQSECASDLFDWTITIQESEVVE